MPDVVKIGLSRGLLIAAVLLAIIHASMIGYVASVYHPPKSHWQQETGWKPEPATGRPLGDSPYRSVQTFNEPASVNLNAQGEMKQQLPCVNGSCATPSIVSNPYNLRPGETLLHVGPSRPVSPIHPTLYPHLDSTNDPSQLPTIPAANSVSQSRPAQAKKPYQVALFLDASSQSRDIASWFQSHEKLSALRQLSEFQFYTADNPLYRSRYATTIPVDQFPVVLIQDSTGGHIHAASRNKIPATSDELWSDIYLGAQLWRQAKQGDIQMTGALKSEGYSWDDRISPDMRLNANDCPDGFCPPSQTDRDGPFARLFDRDRDRNGSLDLRNLFVWGGPNDIATIAVFAMCFGVLIYIIARGR
jgi:hypothetical protein